MRLRLSLIHISKLEERSVRRLSLMRNAQAYDCERLGYRFVKRCFCLLYTSVVLTGVNLGAYDGIDASDSHVEIDELLDLSLIHI